MIKLSSSIHRKREQDAGHTHTCFLCWEKGKCVYMHTQRVNSFQYAQMPSEDMLGEVLF